jgi:hypothetical protein
MENASLISEQLSEIESVRHQLIEDGALIKIENLLPDFTLILDVSKVIDFQWVPSPFGDKCLQFFLEDEQMLIIAPDDFVFDVQQDSFIKVSNLPPICSIQELLMGFQDYRHNPVPSPNYDENVGLFYLHLSIFRSAQSHGIAIPMMDELIRIGKANQIWMDV